MRRLTIMVMGGDNCANSALVHSIVENVNKDEVKTIPLIGTVNHGVEGILKDKRAIPILLGEIQKENPSYQWGVSREPLCFQSAKKLRDYINNTGEDFKGLEEYVLSPKKISGNESSETRGMSPEQKADYALMKVNKKRVSDILQVLAKDIKTTDLVIIGGDGTQRAVKQFCEIYQRLEDSDFENIKKPHINIISVPSSMDNNFDTRTLQGTIRTAVCPGYSSALEETIRDTQRMTATCKSGKRVMFVETMGGLYNGWVTAGTEVGGAQIQVFSEMILDNGKKVNATDFAKNLFELIEHYLNKDGYAMVGMFEPTLCPIPSRGGSGTYKWAPSHYSSSGSRVVGAGLAYQQLCLDHFKNRKSGKRFIYPSYQNLGYLAKAGPTSQYDLALSECIGQKVADLLKNPPDKPYFVALEKVVPLEQLKVQLIGAYPIDSVGPDPFGLSSDYLNRDELSMKNSFLEFVGQITSTKRSGR